MTRAWILFVAIATAGCGMGEPTETNAYLGEAHAEGLLSAARSEAWSRYAAGDHAGFVALMEPVVEEGNVDVDWYNLACGYALLGRTEQALDALAVVAGRGQSYGMESDTDLVSLRGDPRFHEIVRTALLHEQANDFLEPFREQAMEAHRAGRYAEFTTMMEQIARYSAAEVDVYNLACGYALTGRSDEAITTLGALFDRGADFGAATDSDFDSLRGDPRFQALLARAP